MWPEHDFDCSNSATNTNVLFGSKVNIWYRCVILYSSQSCQDRVIFDWNKLIFVAG